MIWPDCKACQTPLPNCTCVTGMPYPAATVPPSQSWYFWTGPQQDAQQDARPLEHDADRFPHECPKCFGPAFIGLALIEHEYPTECK